MCGYGGMRWCFYIKIGVYKYGLFFIYVWFIYFLIMNNGGFRFFFLKGCLFFDCFIMFIFVYNILGWLLVNVEIL